MATETAITTREERYEVKVQSVSVKAQHTLGNRSLFDVELLDISPNGVKIHCPETVRFQEKLILYIRTADLSMDVSIEAEVRWMRACENGWKLGCYLPDGLPEECLQRLGETGSCDRRQNERVNVEIQGECVKAGESKRLPIVLADVSHRGFRFLTNEEFRPCEPIRLFLDDSGEAVIAFPKWVYNCQEGESQVGCLVSAKSLKRYRAILTDQVQFIPSPGWSRLRTFCIFLLAVIAGVTITLTALTFR